MFFKIINQKALDAYKKLDSDHLALRENARLFAEEYDADPIVLQDSDFIWFCGIKFRNGDSINRQIWTKPSREYGHSWLRVKPLKKTLQAEYDVEMEKWKALRNKYFPTGHSVSKNDFYAILGLDASSFFFSSFKLFEFEGVFYVDTTIEMKNAVEILGTEYSQAQEQRNAALRGIKG
ncbi:hypothetical protein [Acinetobacter junii]|nr:hypothetical protein [Acinetobacter junii]